MRALVISDIHANLPALEAVLAAAHYDAVWNLGDIVGYGASPNDVIDLVRNLGGIIVRGNHDRACSGTIAGFNPLAACAARWTQKVLTEDNQLWLSKLSRGPLRPLGARVSCVHGTPKHEYEYLTHQWHARSALGASRAWITFFGHTHLQEGWISDQQEITLVRPNFPTTEGEVRFEVALSRNCRYIINPGSVGQPRDGDWRAAFAIYDDLQSKLIWHRVPYKLFAAQRRIWRAGLPAYLGNRLRRGR